MRDEFDGVLGELRWRGPPLPLIEPTKLFEYNIRVIGAALTLPLIFSHSTRLMDPCGTGGLLGAYTVSLQPELLRAAATAADALIDCAEQWDEALPMPTGRLAPPGEPGALH